MDEIKALCLAAVFLPLGAALLSGLFGKCMGRIGAHTVTIFAVLASFILSAYLAYKIHSNSELTQNFNLYTWGNIGAIRFYVGFLLDRLSVLMMVVVSFVSCMVHIYAVGYMRDDPGYQRFFSYISLFTFGMLMLVSSNNFLQLFFGWEMVGLMSYLLIGLWYKKEKAIFANLKAFIVNRIGDFGFILGISGILYYFGTLDYALVFEQAERVHVSGEILRITSSIAFPAISAICFCLFIGAMGKSAQVPLHVWLPDSMEGPTPISALIHAATMVTAGIFMLARLSPLFEFSNEVLNFILCIGSLTCLLMGLVGIVENDIKRIIAYSTLSQLGYMMVAMGVSAYPLGIFHLTTHAFFKALLFLGAGSVIMALHHEQDIWKMGNLRKSMPITYCTMLIGSLALIGFPFFSGFYSKDLIIEAVRFSNSTVASIAYPIVLGNVFITALYTFRLFFVVFHADPSTLHVHSRLTESPKIIWIPLVLLAIPSVFSGGLIIDGLFQDYFKDSVFIHADHVAFKMLTEEYHGAMAMGFSGFMAPPFWLSMAGVTVAWVFYIQLPLLPVVIARKCWFVYQVLKNQFGFNAFNQKVIIRGTRAIGRVFMQVGEKWLIDGIGVNGTARMIGRFSNRIREFQTGYLYHYAFMMIMGFLFLLVWLVLSEKR